MQHFPVDHPASVYEYMIASDFVHQTSLCDLPYQSYLPIVGAGYNSAILHYTTAQNRVASRDLLLIDAAGMYKGYTSDVTRTWPVNGRFSARQAQLYQMVYRVQKISLSLMRPGADFSAVSSNCTASIAQELLNVWIDEGVYVCVCCVYCVVVLVYVCVCMCVYRLECCVVCVWMCCCSCVLYYMLFV
jgi:Xaa-Pro aminopeptidase